MLECYFDMETSLIVFDSCNNIDFSKMKILTIQYQFLNSDKVTILKEWESNEETIIRQFMYVLKNNFYCVFVGKSLEHFDLALLKTKLKQYGMFNMHYYHYFDSVIDLMSILTIMNNGELKGCNKIIPKTDNIDGSQIPLFYENEEYDKIISYIQNETNDILDFYKKIKKYLLDFKV